MEKVKVGIIGTSWWADKMYLPSLTNHPLVIIKAVAGRNPEKTKEFANRWKIPNYFINAEKLINEAEIDALIIATSNDSHCPLTLMAIERGLHVLCEKPMGISYSEAIAMQNAADKMGIINMVPFTYRFMPTARFIKELVDDGYLGKLYHLNMRYYGNAARQPGYLWRFDMRKAGTGVLGDIGSHFIYIAYWLFGEITQVKAQLDSFSNRPLKDPEGNKYPIAEDTALINLKFKNGAQGIIHASMLAHEPTVGSKSSFHYSQLHQMEFHGSEGTIHSITDWHKTQQVSGTKIGEGPIKKLEIPDHIWGNARRGIVQETYNDIFHLEGWMTGQFIDAIVKGKKVLPDFHEGAVIQRILDAALISNNENRGISPFEIN